MMYLIYDVVKNSTFLSNIPIQFFRFDKEELIGHGRIVALLENGKKIRSETSTMPLDG